MPELLQNHELAPHPDEQEIGAFVLAAAQPEMGESREVASFPDKDEVKETVREALQQSSLPDTYRETDNFSEANVVDISTLDHKPEITRLQHLYADQAAQKASKDAWWIRMSSALQDLGADRETADTAPLVERHDIAVTVEGKDTGQGFEVFEIGEKEQDEEAVGAVFSALETVDQFSGGLLAASSDKPRIVLLNDVKLGQNNGGGETGGAAIPGVVLLNMPALKEMARESGADFHALVATSTVHEILGHDLERLTQSRTGTYFSQHFNYSREREKGEIFDEVHVSVNPKDETLHSHPVREYGKVNASEDFATSVDAAVATAMGWSEDIKNLPRFASTEDAHRTELALELMQKAAEAALQYDHTPGIVGSEIRFRTDEQGKVMRAEPLRKMEITTTPGDVALKQEVQKLISEYTPDELIVSAGDFM